MAPHQDTQPRSRPIMGKDGPSDSALAASSGWRLRRAAAERHAARCASRSLCSGGAPWRYSPSEVQPYRVADDLDGKPVILICLRGGQNVHAVTLPYCMEAPQVDNAVMALLLWAVAT